MLRFLVLFSFCCILDLTPSALAGVAGARVGELDWRFDGFGTLGVVFSDSDNLGFRSDAMQRYTALSGSPQFRNDTLFGAQISANYGDQLSAALQVKGRYRHKGFDVYGSMAYVGYQPWPNIKIRAGRLLLDMFLLSESRSIGFSRPWVRPVEEFYGPILVEFFDGVDASYGRALGKGYLEFRGSVGKVRHPYSLTPSWKALITYNPFWTVNASYTLGDWRFRFGYMDAHVTHFDHIGYDDVVRDIFAYRDKLPLAFFQELDGIELRNVDISHASLALSYDDGLWSVSSEVARPDYQLKMLTAYASVGYRFGAVTPYAVIGRVYAGKRNFLPSAALLSPEARKRFNYIVHLTDGGANQTSLTLGVRWDLSSQLAVKAQFAHRRVGQDGVFLWLEEPSLSLDERVNTLSFSMDFVF